MRIKPGFKAWSTLSAMLLSVAVISGCNDEGAAPTTTPTPTPAPAKGPEMTKPTTPPPPTTPKTEEKTPEKK